MKYNFKKIQDAFVFQKTQNSCGIACLCSIMNYFQKDIDEVHLTYLSGTTQNGATLLGLKEAANQIGLASEGYEGNLCDLKSCELPAILHVVNEYGFTHFVVCYGFDYTSGHFIISDPAIGIKQYTEEELDDIWKSKILLTVGTLDIDTLSTKNLKKNNLKTYLLPLIKSDARILLLSLILSCMTALISLATAVFVQALVDTILPQKNIKLLMLYILIYGMVVLLSQLASYANSRFIITQNILFNVRIIRMLLKKIFQLPKSFFSMIKTGEIISRINDTEKIQGSIILLVNSIFIELLIMSFSILILFYYDWSIALTTAFSIPFLAVFSYLYSKKINLHQKKLMNEYAALETYSIYMISGMTCIKSYQKEHVFFRRLLFFYKNTQKRGRDLKVANANFDLYIGTLSSIFSIMAIMLSSYYVTIGRIQLGVLFAIVTISTMIIQASIKISSYIVDIQEARVAFERSAFILNTITEKELIKEGNTAVHMCSQNELECRNVSFRYPGQMTLLENLNIKVGTGNFISIFGSVGSGKTTLTDLLQRNYVPYSGEILFQGTDIKNYQLSQWRSYLGVVSQYTKIFIGTVADNITMFKSVSIEDVSIFCKELGLEQFLQDDNLNLYNMLDENGNNLSGGQRQLIGIARALYKSPEILIIDEPTASMDKVNEMQVLSLLQRLKNRMAILMITHKPEIARMTDCIYVLDKNTFLQHGDHHTLMQSTNLYSRAYEALFYGTTQ